MNPTTLLIIASLVISAWAVWLNASGLHAMRRHKAKHQKLTLFVAERRNHADGLFSVMLMDSRGRQLPRFKPGQHLQVSVPSQPGISRAYSLAAWQTRPTHYELTIKQEPNGRVSPLLAEQLLVGQIVQTSPPKGHFVLNRQHREGVILVAAGVGITPMRAMLHALLSRQTLPTITLWYASRHLEGLVYHEELNTLASLHPNFRYCPILSQPPQDWNGLSGRLDAQHIYSDIDSDYYFCASHTMMEQLQEGLQTLGIPTSRLHWESFGARSASTNKGPFLIQLESGEQCEWAGQPSLLHALDDAAIAIRAECRAGECGLCRVNIKTGAVNCHGNARHSLAHASDVLACCITPDSDLMIARSE